ncbi:type 1 glutamine amidotransferase family protein [Methanobacterium aggregans]|uniref:type 1 glutamine amidotransferase family protein n=1 Tax=Methanobacterium aggregans TaxID=1615586 RepID=UPI001AE65806|nr:type 1 glutamine amidotransferase family protein [Methanobacterium aggregans]MBP2044998.1 putative intracellular protease/amidase [Methanobacterium aggregans]
MRTAYLLVFNGLSDWEPGLAVAEINKSRDYTVKTVGFNEDTIVTMGGVSIIPDCTIDEIDYSNAAIIILPGGEMWENDPVTDLVPVVEKFIKKGIPVAAICGTTVFLARHGFLEDIKHTSNGKSYLQNLVGKYKGNDLYVNKPSVSDNGIITANGIASLEFARDVLGELGVYDKDTLNVWYDFFKNPQLNE